MRKLLLRWSLGEQDTTQLSDFKNNQDFFNFLWLAKLSIVSFQKRFPDARFVIFYNGNEFEKFKEIFSEIKPEFLTEVEYVDQNEILKNISSPYHFFPRGVWFKWIPFRYDINYNEISIDTDIICIDDPTTWKKWLESDEEIIIAPERFEKVVINTCGDLYKHPLIRGKKPLNCGIVGHRIGYDFSEKFFEVTEAVRFGETHDSLFITEQGTINLWAYSLINDDTGCYVLDFEKNAWFRDFLYYMQKGIRVETVHATSWHKKISKSLQEVLERKVFDESYTNQKFVTDVLTKAKDFGFAAKHVIDLQMDDFNRENVDLYFC